MNDEQVKIIAMKYFYDSLIKNFLQKNQLEVDRIKQKAECFVNETYSLKTLKLYIDSYHTHKYYLKDDTTFIQFINMIESVIGNEDQK